MANDSISRLPAYPSTNTRKSLSPSQLATINQTISSSILQTIALPPTKRDTPATRTFVASYTKDAALQVLQDLIWEPQELSKDEKVIRKRTLVLAEKLASAPPGLDIQILLDLSITYASMSISQLRSIFVSSLNSDPTLIHTVESDLVSAFTQLLSPLQGLYAIRKASHCITSVLQSSPPELIRPFTHSKSFILALATIYDQGLASIAHSYGGFSVLRNTESRDITNEWERIWVETKVSLMDAFHIILTSLVHDISSASGRSLALESEYTFDIIFALLELPTPTSVPNVDSIPPTPFLNRSILIDYQGTYSLSHTLSSALCHAADKDARLDLLESTLQSLDSPTASNSTTKDPGALKILLRSSGIPPGIDNLGHRKWPSSVGATNKGKGKALVSSDGIHASSSRAHTEDTDIDIKISQVLDILPEQPSEYIRALFEHLPLESNAEKVIEALLEGTAPTAEELRSQFTEGLPVQSDGPVNDDVDGELVYVKDRRNLFDDDAMDLRHLRIGKKRGEDELFMRGDRTYIEQMKADILRRAEKIADEEEEDRLDNSTIKGETKGKGRRVELAFDDDDDDDDLDGASKVRISGDGEESGDATESEQEEEQDTPGIETILELAYIRDPKLFDRDAATRRSKVRSDLKTQTGWGDEQIEGWRIMLERNPRKEKILQKHEFSGNQNQIGGQNTSNISSSSQDRGRGGGRGRGRGGRGGGRGGRGGRSNGDGDEASSARERAWKDKNKASHGNHNRKRGHDKKMARAVAGPSV